ncbi:MAG: hypothetical protein IJ067_09305 [Prevotella sp.]|nr:hypothetical protein [Prevotella sp.]
MIRKTSLLLAALTVSSVLSAQMVKEITVSQENSYTDHVSLKEDSRDMDLMVKFVFNEEANTLTVSLISYRTLFVFWDQVRYKPTFRGRTLRPKMLPYVVESDPDDRFRVSKVLKWSIPKPRKSYVFNRWNSYDGLQPTPQDYKMVNDYISQTFDILNKRSQVSVTLRDIFLMEHTDVRDYEIFFGKDLYTQYQVTIQRDPCYGKDEDIKSAQDAEKSIAAAYASINDKYGSGQVTSQESLKLFQEMQDLLISQYPRKEAQSDCPDIQAAYDSYNQYVESISRMTCRLVTATSAGAASGLAGILPKTLLLKARQIDQLVARWMNSRDVMERRDLVKQCDSVVKAGEADISSQGAYSAEQKQAVSVFREAVQYFNKTCK